MTINCKDIGVLPYSLTPGDGFQLTFDISTWLGVDTIVSVVYSATDEYGDDVTATALTLANHSNTTTVIKPWVLGAATTNKQYTVKMAVTTAAAMKKAFYIKYSARNM